MNKVFLIGNLTRDPELTTTPSGVSVCRFSIAVNRQYTQGDGERKTDYFNCTAWRGLGENLAKYQKKGNKIAVTGSIQIRDYEDNNGQKRTAVDIVSSDIEFLSSARNGESDGNADFAGGNGRTAGKRPTLEVFDDDGDMPF